MNASPPINAAADDDALLRAAEALAWREDPAGVSLPTVLTRPSLEGAVGSLDYSEPDDPKSAAWPRWKITGSAHAIIMAKKLFGTDSNASDGKVNSISFPATLGSFDELLLLLHRFPLKMTADASAIFERMYRQLVAERHIAASVPAEAAGGRGHEQTERTCKACGAVKITIIGCGDNHRRAWRKNATAEQVETYLALPCEPKP